MESAPKAQDPKVEKERNARKQRYFQRLETHPYAPQDLIRIIDQAKGVVPPENEVAGIFGSTINEKDKLRIYSAIANRKSNSESVHRSLRNNVRNGEKAIPIAYKQSEETGDQAQEAINEILERRDSDNPTMDVKHAVIFYRGVSNAHGARNDEFGIVYGEDGDEAEVKIGVENKLHQAAMTVFEERLEAREKIYGALIQNLPNDNRDAWLAMWESLHEPIPQKGHSELYTPGYPGTSSLASELISPGEQAPSPHRQNPQDHDNPAPSPVASNGEGERALPILSSDAPLSPFQLDPPVVIELAEGVEGDPISRAQLFSHMGQHLKVPEKIPRHLIPNEATIPQLEIDSSIGLIRGYQFSTCQMERLEFQLIECIPPHLAEKAARAVQQRAAEYRVSAKANTGHAEGSQMFQELAAGLEEYLDSRMVALGLPQIMSPVRTILAKDPAALPLTELADTEKRPRAASQGSSLNPSKRLKQGSPSPTFSR